MSQRLLLLTKLCKIYASIYAYIFCNIYFLVLCPKKTDIWKYYARMENEEINFTQKNAKEYRCDACDYKCCNKFDFNRHLSTRKHSDSVNGNLAEMKKTSIACKCGKE